MVSITFDLETVTPLFLGGADQQNAELRPPAFRGALRYWFRAIIGGYYWQNTQKLKDIESSIFGDTSEQNGSSKIVLRLSKYSPNSRPSEVKQIHDLEGLKYLWFSMKMTNRKAIGAEEPASFSLTFSTRPNPRIAEQQQKNLLILANCFWFAVNLGGFGSRERRGAGSLRILKATSQGLNSEFEKKLPRFTTNLKPEDVKKYFKGEIRKIQRNCKELLGITESPKWDGTELPDFEIYRQDLTKIYRISTPYSSWEEALNDIGQEYSSYRKNYRLQERFIFGLPLTKVDMKLRRPSPLRIKIIQSVKDYYCFLIRTYANFPERFSMDDLSHYQLIDNFINSLEDIEEVV